MHATGPRTEDGKRRSAMNATTHGLTARTPLVEGEDAGDYAAFVSGIVASLRPEGTLEDALAERAAVCLWRVQRAPRVEAALLNVPPHHDATGEALASVTGDAPPLPDTVTPYTANGDALERLARYETHAERSAYRALAELRQVQAARRAAAPA